jgi:hypothetical protein
MKTNSLKKLTESYETLSRAFETESRKKFNMQTYVGEAVLDELLHQSYDLPEYTTEAKLKRIISCVLSAMENYKKGAINIPPLFEGSINTHLLPNIEPNGSNIELRTLKLGADTINIQTLPNINIDVSSKKNQDKKGSSKKSK